MELVKKYRVIFQRNNSAGFKYMFNDTELAHFVEKYKDCIIEVIEL